jgi:hypothetical protein
LYVALHALWSAHAGAPGRFPSAASPPAVDPLALLLAPVTARVGAPVLVTLLMLGGLLATLGVAWRYTRRHTSNVWIAAAATAAFSASPAFVAGVTSGDLDAWQGWALLAFALCAGPAALVVGPLAALFAPTMLPAAALPTLLSVGAGRGAARWWPLAGWALAVTLRTAIGWPNVVSRAGFDAWFTALAPAPAPERVFQVYIGFSAVTLLVAALVRPGGRAFAAVGAVALAGALITAPVPPERFLHLVPLVAVLGGLPLITSLFPRVSPAAAVLAAAVLVGEGWRGVAAPVPLSTTPLAAYAPRTEVATGPVLDLPLTLASLRRALWLQTSHGQPIVVDPEGAVADEVMALGTALTAGTCAAPASLGFRTVIARREGPLRELGPLITCLGPPTWDDGAVALWRIEGEAQRTDR